MTLTDLYAYAEDHNIIVECFHLPKSKSISIMDKCGRCAVGIDPIQLRSEYDEKEMLSHEISHCETGAFYTEYDGPIVRAKCEARALRWEIRNNVPYDELMNAVADGCTEAWEFAEYFDVPESLMRKAIEFYQAGNR